MTNTPSSPGSVGLGLPREQHYARETKSKYLRPLLEQLQLLSDPTLTQVTLEEISALRPLLKQLLHEVEELSQAKQARTKSDYDKDNGENHMRTPGSLILAPIMEPLGNLNIPITDAVRIATPVGNAICKIKPQVVICPWKDGAVTAIIGSRQGRPFTKQEILGDSSVQEKYIKLVDRPREDTKSLERLIEIEVQDGTFTVKESSVLNGAAFNIVRFQDVKDCYHGSHIAPSSIQPLIELMFNNFVEKMRCIATAHRLQLEASLKISGQADTHRTTPRTREKRGGVLSPSNNGVSVGKGTSTLLKGAKVDGDPGREEERRELEHAANELKSHTAELELQSPQSLLHSLLGVHRSGGLPLISDEKPAPGSDTNAAKYIRDVCVDKEKGPRIDTPARVAAIKHENVQTDDTPSKRASKRRDHGKRNQGMAQYEYHDTAQLRSQEEHTASRKMTPSRMSGRPPGRSTYQEHGFSHDPDARHSQDRHWPSADRPNNRKRSRSADQELDTSI